MPITEAPAERLYDALAAAQDYFTDRALLLGPLPRQRGLDPSIAGRAPDSWTLPHRPPAGTWLHRHRTRRSRPLPDLSLRNADRRLPQPRDAAQTARCCPSTPATAPGVPRQEHHQLTGVPVALAGFTPVPFQVRTDRSRSADHPA